MPLGTHTHTHPKLSKSSTRLFSPRKIQSLNFLNYFGVAAATLLAAIAAALGGAALASGSAAPLPAAPSWDQLGGGGLAGAAEVAGIVAVLLACYVGHQNIHPILPLLTPYTGVLAQAVCSRVLAGCEQTLNPVVHMPACAHCVTSVSVIPASVAPKLAHNTHTRPAGGRMRGVLAAALSVAALVFSTLCIGSALAFGPALQVRAHPFRIAVPLPHVQDACRHPGYCMLPA